MFEKFYFNLIQLIEYNVLFILMLFKIIVVVITGLVAVDFLTIFRVRGFRIVVF